jgi:hypothetical protein
MDEGEVGRRVGGEDEEEEGAGERLQMTTTTKPRLFSILRKAWSCERKEEVSENFLRAGLELLEVEVL